MNVLYIYSFLLALTLSLVLIPYLIRNSARWGLVDDPEGSQRKLHTRVVPRSGGLGIVLAAAVAILVLLPVDQPIVSYILGCLIIAGFGLLDDFVELKPWQKLAGQAIGVAVAMAGGMVFSDFPFFPDAPVWLTHTVTFFFVLGVINGVNFSDGMDGLAAGTALMALVLVFVLAIESADTTAAVISLAVAAALLGFLRFNTHPATIFMGDAGSQFLGFSLAWLSISVSQGDSGAISPLIPLLVLGIPVMDIIQVVPVRIKKKLPLPGPDKEHFHHQIAKLGYYQYEVVAIIYILQTALLCGAYVLRSSSDTLVLGVYLIFVAITLGALLVANSLNWKVRELDTGGHHRRNKFFRWLGQLHPYTGTFFVSMMAACLFASAIASTALAGNLAIFCVLWSIVLLGLFLAFQSRWPLGIGRLSSYTASIFLAWGLTESIGSGQTSLAIDSFAALMAILLVFAIRITRKHYFNLTTEDLLVALFFLALSPFLLNELGHGSLIMSLIFRVFVLLYVCEFVLARGERARKHLTYAAMIALAGTLVHI